VDRTDVDLGSHFIVQVRRLGLRDLLRRSDPLPIHIHVRSPEKIPSVKLTFLSRGGKFIPDRSVIVAQSLRQNLVGLARQLDAQRVFTVGQIPSSEDLSAFFLLGYKRAMATHRFLCHELKNNLCIATQIVFAQTLVFLLFDKAAMSLLKNNADSYVTVDVDKGLGEGIFDRAWAQTVCYQHLNRNAIVLGKKAFEMSYAGALEEFQVIKDSLENTLSTSTWNFLSQRLARPQIGICIFRPKVHKPNLSARPVFNLSKSALQPLALYLCEALAPLLDLCGSSLSSTDKLKKLFGQYIAWWPHRF